MDRRQNNYAIV